MESYWIRDETHVSCTGRWIPYHRVIREASDSDLHQLTKYLLSFNFITRKIGMTIIVLYGEIRKFTSHKMVQFSHSVVSDSLRSHEVQHARPLCPSPTPGDDSNSCPLSWLWHLAISSSVVPFSSCPQSLPASGSFPMSQLFT